MLRLVLAIALALDIAEARPARAATALEAAQQGEMLAAHNRWRREVGVADLRWADDLADTAQRWADQLRVARNCIPAHGEHALWGENLYWAGAVRWSDGRAAKQEVSPTRVVGSWAGEKPLYDERSGNCRPGTVCGHYTQLVWRRTTEVGCGMAVCPDLSQVWVCHYRPPGNYLGQRAF